MLIFVIYNSTLKVQYDLNCVESAVKLQSANQPSLLASITYLLPYLSTSLRIGLFRVKARGRKR